MQKKLFENIKYTYEIQKDGSIVFTSNVFTNYTYTINTDNYNISNPILDVTQYNRLRRRIRYRPFSKIHNYFKYYIYEDSIYDKTFFEKLVLKLIFFKEKKITEDDKSSIHSIYKKSYFKNTLLTKLNLIYNSNFNYINNNTLKKIDVAYRYYFIESEYIYFSDLHTNVYVLHYLTLYNNTIMDLTIFFHI